MSLLRADYFFLSLANLCQPHACPSSSRRPFPPHCVDLFSRAGRFHSRGPKDCLGHSRFRCGPFLPPNDKNKPLPVARGQFFCFSGHFPLNVRTQSSRTMTDFIHSDPWLTSGYELFACGIFLHNQPFALRMYKCTVLFIARGSLPAACEPFPTLGPFP